MAYDPLKDPFMNRSMASKPLQDVLREALQAALEPVDPDANLPSNVWRAADGVLYVNCCVCGRTCDVDPEWFSELGPEDEYEHMGGCSPHCCP